MNMDRDTDVYHRYQIDTNMLLPIDTQNIWVSVGMNEGLEGSNELLDVGII